MALFMAKKLRKKGMHLENVGVETWQTFLLPKRTKDLAAL